MKVLDGAVGVLFAPDQIVELRVLNTRRGIVSGYFDDYEKFAASVAQWNGKAPGIYATLNPVDPDLLARSVNHVQEYAKQTTSDTNIISRRWLPIDLDPVRPSGISSTDEEHELALERTRDISRWLVEELGFPRPILSDSGNGGHLLEAIDLPNTPESTALVRRCIEALALRFSDDRVVVDLTTFNPARIWKVYGTKACKGDSTPERPHRMAALLEVPEKIEIASVDLLKKLAALAPEEPKQDHAYRANGAAFDIDAFLAKAALGVAFADVWQGGRKWILKTCPWNSDHQNRSAFILQFPSGAVTAGCHHNGCAGKGWADLRNLYEPKPRPNQSSSRANFRNEAKKDGPANPQPKKPFFETLKNVEEEMIDWLWKNRIPRGKLTLFDGDPGIGKSYTALAIAAALSNGQALPFDEEPEAPLRSLIISAEDGPADTIKPRLRILGADMGMIAIPNRALGFTPSVITASLIDGGLKEWPAALVVIDPIIAFANRRNTDKASDVRDLLGPLALVAEKHKAAVILIRHLNKSLQAKALYRGQGSIDFAAACRSAFVFAQDGDNPERRLMAHTKGSMAGLQSTIEFYIDRDGAFRWGGQTSDSADEALETGERRGGRQPEQLEAAKKFLAETLAGGPAASNKIKERAEKAGIGWRTIWRAKEALGVRSAKSRETGEWFWKLA